MLAIIEGCASHIRTIPNHDLRRVFVQAPTVASMKGDLARAQTS